MQFEANAGQTADQVKFLSRGPGYTLFLTPTQAILSLRSGGKEVRGASVAALRMSLVDANPQPQGEGLDELPGTVNYFLGADPKQWRAGIRTFGKIKFSEVYPGVDLVYYGNQRQVEYDFIVAANADPNRIALQFSGAERLEVDEQGGLIAHVVGGTVRWHKPFAYQNTETGRQEIAANFVLKKSGQVVFQIAAYDTSRPLIIDPVLVYATYLGGGGADYVSGVGIDSGGGVYVMGDTSSLNFPTTNAFRPAPPGSNDVFVAKFNSNGTALIYSTYLGGSANDYAGGIAVDASGNAYLAGQTGSANFPTLNAFKTSRSGGFDTFVTKLGPDGTNLLYSTYLGGTDDDSANAIAVDSSGNAYFAGDTYSIGTGASSTRFPSTQGAYQANNAGGRDAFVAKINTASSGSASLVYCTFLGGDSEDKANAITIDTSGNAYVIGVVASFPTYPDPPSSSFPIQNAFQSSFNRGSTDPLAGSTDGFLTKLNPAGNSLVFSTFLGGQIDDSVLGVALDPAGRICVIGETSSKDFPVTNAIQSVIGGAGGSFPPPDAFIAQFQTNGASLRYSTYLGGAGYESGFFFYRSGIAVDGFGDIYVTGETASSNFPLTLGADQTNRAGYSDAFVAKINPAVPGPASLIYSTLLGGDQDERGTGIAVDTNGNFYVAGHTASTSGFPVTPSVFRSTNSGGLYDAFAAEYSSPPDLSVTIAASIEPVIVGSNITCTIQVNNNGRSTFNTVTNAVQLPPNVQIISVTSTKGDWTTNGTQLLFNLGSLTNNASVLHTIVLQPLTPVSLTNAVTITSTDAEPNTANNFAKVISTVRGIADLALTASAAPNPVFVSSNLVYTIAITNTGPWPATSMVVTDSLPAAVKFVSAALTQGSSSNSGNVVTWNLGSLAAGAGALATITTVAMTNGTATANSGVRAYELDPISTNNTASTVVTISPLADLVLKKTVSTNSTFAGANLIYTLLVTNRGPSTATDVVATDTLPAGANYVSATTSQGSATQTNGIVTCTLGTLASNANATVTITVTPVATGSLTNTASVTSAMVDPTSTNNSSSAVTTVAAGANLVVSKKASTNSVYAGASLIYTIFVTNRGPSTATGVLLTDPLPATTQFISAQTTQGTSTTNGAGTLLTCDIGTLASNAIAQVTLTVRPVGAGSITNTASASSAITDITPSNNTASVVTTVNPAAELSVVQNASPNPVFITSNVTFTVVVKNNGPSLATSVVLTNRLVPATNFVSAQTSQGSITPATNGETAVLTCNLGSLASNATATVTIVANSSVGGWITNTANVISALADIVSSNNSASAVVSVVDSSTDLAVSKTASTNSVFIGTDLTYTITITNSGPLTATNTVLTDPLPPRVNFVSAQTTQGNCIQSTNGAVVTVVCGVGDLSTGATATVTVTVRPVVTGSITNTATVNSALVDLLLSDNSASVVTTVNPAADLAVSKSVSTNSAFAGNNLTYTIVVANQGPSTAAGVLLTDLLPAETTFVAAQSTQGNCSQTNGVVTCDLGSIANNASATVTVTVNAVIPGSVTNTATVVSATADLVSSNNAASVVATIVPVADVSVSKTASPNPVLLTSNITFTVVVTNAGPSLATSVVVTDTLPAGTTFVSAQSTQGNCTETNGVVTCDVGDLDSNTVVTLTITVTATTEGSITNTASATSSRPDLNLDNNSASAVAVVNPIADLAVSKTVSTNSVPIGSSLTYTVVVTNRGPSTVTNVVLTDALPPGVAFVSAQTSQGNNSHLNNVVTCQFGALVSNATASVTINVTTTAVGPATNSASVVSEVTDFFLANNSALVIATVNPVADLSVSKTVSTNVVVLGSNVVYTVIVTNQGPSAATSVVLTDALPATLTFISAETTAGSLQTATNGEGQVIVSAELGTMDSQTGATLTITANAGIAGPITNIADVTSVVSDPVSANNSDFAAASVIIPSEPLADVVVGKAASTNTILVGSNLTFTISATNHGPQPAENVVVTDLLPPQFQYLSATTSQGSFSETNGVVTFNLGTLAKDAAAMMTVDVKAVSDGEGTNTAGVSSTTTDPAPDNNAASSLTTVIPIADLAMSKNVSTNLVLIGGSLTYTIVVTNRGPSSATGVVLTDLLPQGVAFAGAQTSQGNYSESNGVVVCAFGALASNATATVTITVGAISEGSVTNSASATSDVVDFTPANNSAAAVATVAPAADLSLSKRASTNAVVAGSNLVYTIIVSNQGPSSASSVTVTDTLPATLTFVSAETTQGNFQLSTNNSQQVLSFDLGSLNPNTNATLTITAQSSSDSGGTSVTNIASAGSGTGDSNVGNNNAAVVVSVITPVDPLADLVVGKVASTNTILVGSNLTFTISATNHGPQPAENVVVTDPLPAQFAFLSATASQGSFSETNGVVTFNLGTLASNETATVTVDVKAVGDGMVANTAGVSSTTTDPVLANNSASSLTTVIPIADLALSKRASTNFVLRGAELVYTIVVTNRGPSTATGTMLTDPLPAGVAFVSAQTSQGNYTESNGVVVCAFGALASNATATVTITVGAISEGSVTNSASATSDVVDFTPANNSAAAVATVAPAADLSLSKRASTNAVVAGSNLVYTIIVTNQGPSLASSVTVTDALPASLTFVSAGTTQGSFQLSTNNSRQVVTFDLGSLSASASATLTIAAQTSPGSGGTTLTNSASASSGTSDPNPGNNSAAVLVSAITPSPPLSDLVVGKVASTNMVLVGSNLTFTIFATNRGPETAPSVVVTDPLPPQCAFVSATASQGGFSESNGVVTFTLGTLTNGATAVLTVDVKAVNDGVVTNTAGISSVATDPVLDNNAASAMTTVIPIADLVLSKQASTNAVFRGGELIYTISVTNRGPSSATGVVLTDALPPGVAFVSAQTSQGNYTESNGVVVCALGALASNATATATITVSAVSDGAITNSAVVTSTVIDFTSANNSASVVTTVNPVADLSLSKTVSSSSPFVSSNVTFTIIVTNRGPSPAGDIVVTDSLPGGFAFFSAQTTQGGFTETNGLVTGTLGTIASNATATLTITATATTNGTFTNTASVTSGVTDFASANNSASAVTTNVPLADLQLSKTVATNMVFASSNLVYTVTVLNRGPSTANGIVITDPLPPGANFVSAQSSQGSSSQTNGVVTCAVGDLAINASAAVTITINSTSPGLIVNTVSATSAVVDPVSDNNAAFANATVVAAADLSVTKTGSPQSVFAGSNVMFTVIVTNHGISPATGIVLTDSLPPTFGLLSVGTAQGSCTESNGVITCNLDDLASGGSATITVLVNATVDGVFTNFAAVTAVETDLDMNNNSASASTTVIPVADLALSKQASTNAVFRGGELTYTVTVTNRGPSVATNIALTDALPPGVAFVSAQTTQGNYNQTNNVVTCMLGSLSSNATATVTITVSVVGDEAITNTASVTSGIIDLDTANNSASAVTAVNPVADLSLSKTVSSGSPFVSSNVTFTIIVTNRGPSPASGVVITDPLPDGFAFVSAGTSQGGFTQTNGLVTGTLGTIASNATATLTITATAITNGTFTNTANVTSGVTDFASANNSASVVVTNVSLADLSLSKTVSSGSPFVSSNVTFTIIVTNRGPSPASGVVITDPLPDGFAFVSAGTSQGGFTQTNGLVTGTLGTIASNATATLTITATAITNGTFTNTANVTSGVTDFASANNSASVVTTNVPMADLQLSKTVATNSVFVSSNLVYTIVVTNQGPSTATSVVVTDALPSNLAFVSAQTTQGTTGTNGNVVTCNVGTLSNGLSATVTITAKAGVAGTVTNTASVASGVVDFVATNNFESAVATINPLADLAVSKKAATNAVFVGSNLDFTIIVTNRGPSTATNIVLTDTLPSGLAFVSAQTTQGTTGTNGNTVTCNIGNLANNATATMTITVAATSPGLLFNMAAVTSSIADPASANNSAFAGVVVNDAADLSVSKTASPNPAFTGSNVTFTIIVTNRGPSTATNIVLTDSLPSGLAFVSAQTAQGACSETNGTVTCALDNMDSNATATVIITAVATSNGTFTNTAGVASAVADLALQNNSASAVSTNIPSADLQLSKTVSTNSVFVGSNLVYTVVVSNRGPSTATAVVVRDALPSGFAFVSSQTSQGTSSEVNGVVTCPLNNLGSNATATITITAVATSAGTFTNTATVTSTVTDPVSGNNAASAGATVVAAADLSVSKFASPNPAFTGSNLTFTITVMNRGISPATGIVLTDSLPLAFALLSVQTAQGSCSQSNGVVICNLNDLTNGGSATITIEVNASEDGTFTNFAGVTAVETDLSPGNNTAGVTVVVFDNPAAPLLRINHAAGRTVVISWTTNLTNFALESKNPFFTNVAWQPVTNVPAVVGNKFNVTNPAAGSGKFYRLIK